MVRGLDEGSRIFVNTNEATAMLTGLPALPHRRAPPVAVSCMALALLLSACASDDEGRHHHRGEGFRGGAHEDQGRTLAIEQLRKLDPHPDGTVTKAGLDHALHDLFAIYDLKHNNRLDVTETRALNAALPARIPGASPVIDWNTDGAVDYAEFSNQWMVFFERLDTNNDGVLTPDEMKSRMRDDHPPEGTDDSKGRPGGEGRRRPGGTGQ